MIPTKMKHYLSLAIGSLLVGGMQASFAAAPASQADDCADLQCLICPQLSAPEEYAQGNMKALKQLVPGRDHWLFRSEVDLTNDFGIPAAMQPEFARLMRAFASHGTQVVMAVQPTRGLMHRAQLLPGQAHGFDYARASGNLRNFLQQMRDAGAIVPDIMGLVQQPPRTSSSAATTTGPRWAPRPSPGSPPTPSVNSRSTPSSHTRATRPSRT